MRLFYIRETVAHESTDNTTTLMSSYHVHDEAIKLPVSLRTGCALPARSNANGSRSPRLHDATGDSSRSNVDE